MKVTPGAGAIGRRLRELRRARGLTLEELERATRRSSPYLSKIERGLTLPPPATLTAIARALRMPRRAREDLLDELGYLRACLELERLGYRPSVAKAAVLLERLGRAELDPALDSMAAALPEEARPRVAPGVRHAATLAR